MARRGNWMDENDSLTVGWWRTESKADLPRSRCGNSSMYVTPPRSVKIKQDQKQPIDNLTFRVHATFVSQNYHHHSLRGGAGRKTVLVIFQPSHFIVYLLWSVWKIWKKHKKKLFSLRLVSIEMVAIFDFWALTKVHTISKPLLQMQWKVAHT